MKRHTKETKEKENKSYLVPKSGHVKFPKKSPFLQLIWVTIKTGEEAFNYKLMMKAFNKVAEGEI